MRGREGERRGREGGREGGREWREGGKDWRGAEREGWREVGKSGGREGGKGEREGGKREGREGGMIYDAYPLLIVMSSKQRNLALCITIHCHEYSISPSWTDLMNML